MTDSPDINTGLVGSLTMIFLSVAFLVLVVSFYRRYKRASESENDQE